MSDDELVVIDKLPTYIRLNEPCDKNIVFVLNPDKKMPTLDGIEKVMNHDSAPNINLHIHTFVKLSCLPADLQAKVRDAIPKNPTVNKEKKQLELFEGDE